MSSKRRGQAQEASPDKATTTSVSGYPEKHGPRSDADGWGEENPDHGKRVGKPKKPNQGQAAGKRSFDGGADATPLDEAAGQASPHEPSQGQGQGHLRKELKRSSKP